MDFSKTFKAFLKALPPKDLNGQQMFLAVAAHLVNGSTSCEIKVSDIQTRWPRSLLRIKYNPVFYSRAQGSDWVDPVRKGIFIIKSEGIQHLNDLSSFDKMKKITATGSLFIFGKKSTHSFDKFLRGIFAKAKSRVFIADSWVDETIFDNVVDSIPKILEIDLLYGKKCGTFDSRITRFKKEYSKFIAKKYKHLHDRFIIVDDIGYILGPSIKDAASNSPALVASLSREDSIMLSKFFHSLWIKAK